MLAPRPDQQSGRSTPVAPVVALDPAVNVPGPDGELGAGVAEHVHHSSPALLILRAVGADADVAVGQHDQPPFLVVVEADLVGLVAADEAVRGDPEPAVVVVGSELPVDQQVDVSPAAAVDMQPRCGTDGADAD